ncbi:MAG TPA: hypothetical protein DCR93_01700, partial [Cytophagales bacterium]|nr:hypothetical protein [Cytophagales bacterium]
QPWLEFPVRDRPYARDFDWSQDVRILKPASLDDVLPDSITERVLTEVIQPLISGQQVYLYWEGENRNLANETRSDSTEVRTAVRWGLECFNYYLANGALPSVGNATAPVAQFVDHPQQQYGFDAFNEALPNDYPEVLLQDSIPYRVAWKSQLALGEPSAQADSISFAIKGISDPATLSLSTPLGNYPVAQRGHDSYGVALPTQPEGEILAELLYTADANADPVVVGLLNVLAYAPEVRTVHIVPVGSANFLAAGAVKQRLDEIYAQGALTWNVEVEPAWDNRRWDLTLDGANLEESGLLTAYPPELRNCITRYQTSHSVNPNHYYLFLVPLAQGEGDLLGYMPRKRKFGFLFSNQLPQSIEAYAVAAAHELGHGAFRFDHWWTETGLPQGTTDNLMDYGGGTTLAKRQWEYIRNPQTVNTLGEEDEDAALTATPQISELADFRNEEGTYTFITPAKTLITLPHTLSEVYFSTGDNWSLQNECSGLYLLPIGTLAFFALEEEGEKNYFYAQKQCGNDQFMGYASANSDISYFDTISHTNLRSISMVSQPCAAPKPYSRYFRGNPMTCLWRNILRGIPNSTRAGAPWARLIF